MIPVLPDDIADKLDDATPASDAATDAEVKRFFAEHTAASRPEILNGWIKALEKHFAEHESRHGSTVSVMAGALKEARAGYLSAQDALDELGVMFHDEVAKPPASSKQNPARNGKVAAEELRGIVAWAVGQANAADLEEVRARVEEKMFDNRAWINNISSGTNGQAAPAGGQAAPADTPRVWWANDLKPAVQPRWLAKNRLPRGAVSLLIGDEGIGKSLLWVLIVAHITTGKELPEFGIPARAPGHVIVAALTEDDWQSVVLPRLIVAEANLDMIRVICTDDDGSGAPTFPANMKLITEADPKPDMVVVDAWLDTVPAKLQVKDPQQARQALHPWKEAATTTDAGLLLLCHTNRVDTANARDKYGATGALRQKARMTLFAQTDEDGNLVVGPEKANSAAATNATLFSIDKVQHFEPTEDDDGVVAVLRCAGESTKTARQLLADNHSTGADKSGDAIGWLAIFLANGPCWANEIYLVAELKAGHSKDKLRTARKKLNVLVKRVDPNGPWFWALPQHPDGIPDGTSPPSDSKIPSGKNFHIPGGTSTSQDSLRGNGERRENKANFQMGPVDNPDQRTEPRWSRSD